jgi:hypothetical protein
MFVHGAEFAAVPGTSASDPDESAVSLVGRPERRKIVRIKALEHSAIRIIEFAPFLNE